MRWRHAALAALVCSAMLGARAGPVAEEAARDSPAAGQTLDPTVILVSLDGFRSDYQQLTPTPALDSLAASGVQAESLVPVFPSKTFPSHYSIVTGLYPAHHGIVSNNMRDPRWAEEFHLATPEVSEGRWWGGEPIWTTASRQG